MQVVDVQMFREIVSPTRLFTSCITPLDSIYYSKSIALAIYCVGYKSNAITCPIKFVQFKINMIPQCPL